jgi:hypothetical protein
MLVVTKTLVKVSTGALGSSPLLCIYHTSLDKALHDVASALQAEFGNVHDSLKVRLQQSYGKAYLYFLQWQAVSQVEQAVGIIN